MRTFGRAEQKKDHLLNVRRRTSGNGKGKGRGKDKNLSQSMYHGGKGKARLRCGRKGHVKFNYSLKDEECSSCGETGHLKAVCKAKGANQVEEAVETEDGAA